MTGRGELGLLAGAFPGKGKESDGSTPAGAVSPRSPG
jgi:hypothetical protein